MTVNKRITLVSSQTCSVGTGCATRPSVPTQVVPSTVTLASIRRYNPGDVSFQKDKLLGKGVFGKCYFGYVGPQSACIKVLRKGHKFEVLLANEASLLSHCCHPNIPLLFGIMTTCAGYECLIMSFHGIDGVSFSLHSLLTKKKEHFLMTMANWKRVVVGVVQGLKYLHSHEKGAILHNDLKCDNVVVDNSTGEIKPCIIDFGKACLESNSKLYHLSMSDKDIYRKHHPQVAPDVRDGLYKQSTASDIYSFGRILSAINEDILSIPVIVSMSELCLEYDREKRPSTVDLCTFLVNLFNCD